MATAVKEKGKSEQSKATLQPKKALCEILFALGAIDKARAFTKAMEDWHFYFRGKPLALRTYYHSDKGHVVLIEIKDEDYSTLLTRIFKWCGEEGVKLEGG